MRKWEMSSDGSPTTVFRGTRREAVGVARELGRIRGRKVWTQPKGTKWVPK